jgi:hypothetical protein
MATINYKGLTGLGRTLTVNTTDTLTQITAAAIADETIASDHYADFVLQSNINIKESTDGASTYAALGLTSDDVLIAIMDDVTTKETRITRKINVATVKRKGGPDADTGASYYRPLNDWVGDEWT